MHTTALANLFGMGAAGVTGRKCAGRKYYSDFRDFSHWRGLPAWLVGPRPAATSHQPPAGRSAIRVRFFVVRWRKQTDCQFRLRPSVAEPKLKRRTVLSVDKIRTELRDAISADAVRANGRGAGPHRLMQVAASVV